MKYSKQRSLILEIVKSADNHPTAEWVYEQAKKQMSNIGIATVYRNLNSLADDGEIGRILSTDQSIRFDGHVNEHYHMECESCGKLVDLFPKSSEQIAKLVEKLAESFDIDSSGLKLNKILFKGICKECAKHKSAESLS